MKKTRTIACAVAVTMGSLVHSAAQAATLYFNDFDSAGLTNATAQFTLDTPNGVLKYNQPTGAGVVVGTASQSIAGIGTSEFTVSTRFTLNSIAGSGTTITMGFGAFGASSTFAGSAALPNYLADWAVGGGGTLGTVRILAQGDTSGFSNASGNSGGGGVVGNTYELRLTGAYTLGTLNMSFALFDGVGNQLGTTATATDTSPLSGTFFGFRNRTAATNHAINLSYDNFRVSIVPEPTSATLMALAALGLVAVKRRRQPAWYRRDGDGYFAAGRPVFWLSQSNGRHQP
jgi:hypothetical protein